MSAEITNLNNKKEARDTKAIQQEYANLVMKAGNLQFEIELKKKDLSLMNDQLREINFEYMEAKNREEAAKKSAEQGSAS